MRKTVLISLLLLLTILLTSSLCFAAKENRMIVPGDKIGHLKLGMTQKQVVKILGKPDKALGVKKTGPVAFDYRKNYGMLIRFDVKTKKVTKIGVLYNKEIPYHYSLKNGITFLTPYESVKKELGDVLWFVSEMSYMIGTNLSEVAELNVKKLQDRQKRNTLKGSGNNR